MMTWTLKQPNPTYITHNSCRRPVTEKGRTAARPSVSFSTAARPSRPSVSLARSLARPSAAAAAASCFDLRDE